LKSDGQLYAVKHKGEVLPPPDIDVEASAVDVKKTRSGLTFSLPPDDLLILGIIILLLSDKGKADIPLVLALVYVLIS